MVVNEVQSKYLSDIRQKKVTKNSSQGVDKVQFFFKEQEVFFDSHINTVQKAQTQTNLNSSSNNSSSGNSSSAISEANI